MQTAEKCSLYDQLLALPDTLTGEILNGQLHTQPRPSGPHGRATARLDRTIGRGYDDGEGGPGGWWIFIEPEVHFVRDVEVLVPDLAGWRRERMPEIPQGHRFEIVPDWICEILSPSTASKDREIKMPIFGHYGVRYAWLLDLSGRSLEAYELREGAWMELDRYRGTGTLSVRPFEAVTISLDDLWA
jgi:Uma2 family endonuclease